MSTKKMLSLLLLASLLLVYLALPVAAKPAARKVEYWCRWGCGANTDWLTDVLAPRMKDLYNIEVEVRPVEDDDAIMVAIAAGKTPDIYTQAREEWVVDHRALFDRWEGKNQIPKPVQQLFYSEITGKMASLPVAMFTRGAGYSWTAFMGSGLEPKIPESWDELIAAVKKMTRLTSDGNSFETVGMRWKFDKYELCGSEFGMVLRAGDGFATTPDGRTSLFNSEPTRRALNLLKALYDITTIGGQHAPGNLWAEGKTGIVRGQSWAADSFFAPDSTIEGTVGPFPAIQPGVKPTATVGVNGLAIMNDAKDKEAAYLVWKEMMTFESQWELAKDYNHSSLRMDVWQRAAGIPEMAPRRMMYNLLEYSTLGMTVDGRDRWSPMIISFLKNETGLQAAIEEMARAHQVALNEKWGVK